MWIDKLKERWKIKNTYQIVIILIVFACTGLSVMLLKNPILTFLSGSEERTTFGTVLYYIFILPLYNVLLLIFGFLFGQFNFFWQFEKRFLNRIGSLFKRK